MGFDISILIRIYKAEHFVSLNALILGVAKLVLRWGIHLLRKSMDIF